MIERIMTKRLGVFNVQPSWIIILYSVLEWGHASWLSEDREPRILFYNYLICFYIITHLFHIQSGDYEWLFSKAFKALVKECVNGSIKKTELNNEAKKLRGIWSHHNHSHVPKLFEYLTKVPSPLKNIQHGLRRQTELMEKYFLHQDKKGEFYFHISKQ